MNNEEKILEILAEIKGEITGIKGEITGIKGEITGIKGEITGIKGEITGMKGDIAELKSDNVDLKAGQRRLESQVAENTQMIRSLIHASEVIKADQDALLHDMHNRFNEFGEVQKSLLEMYGSHEADIRILRRKPV